MHRCQASSLTSEAALVPVQASLKMAHDQVVDTSFLFQREDSPNDTPALKDLAAAVLGTHMPDVRGAPPLPFHTVEGSPFGSAGRGLMCWYAVVLALSGARLSGGCAGDAAHRPSLPGEGHRAGRAPCGRQEGAQDRAPRLHPPRPQVRPLSLLVTIVVPLLRCPHDGLTFLASWFLSPCLCCPGSPSS